MIRFLTVLNRQGKVRLSKWYVHYGVAERNQIQLEIHKVVRTRERRWTNFVEYRNYKIIYRQYVGLIFVLCVDLNDNELAAFELIHLLVTVLDNYFGNVCELDLIFHFDKAYRMLDEILLAGEVSETSQSELVRVVKQTVSLE
eukprot:Lankesteria_metandrocarpae@DN3854_c0_g1_i1.p1